MSLRLNTRIFQLALILLAASALALLSSTVFAQTSGDSSGGSEENVIKDWQDATFKERYNAQEWLYNSMGSNILSTLNILTGTIPDEVFSGQGTTSWRPAGALGSTTGLIASLYTPPASGIEYIAQGWNNFLGRPALAQGSGLGFSGLAPLIGIWRSFRNVVYILASLVFIILGVMIMLRIKISSNAVISLQSAIPSIITTLILVTFSYAIAGLLIDIINLLHGVFLAILFQAEGKSLTSSLLEGIRDYSFGKLALPQLDTITYLTQRAIPLTPLVGWAGLVGVILGGIIGLAATGGNPLGAVLGGGAGFQIGLGLVLLILCVMILIWMFKFFFGLLKCYIHVIFKIIIGPLEIAMGAFPQSKLGFGTWLWDIIANMAVFPISLLFMVIANLIIDKTTSYGLWTPSLLNGDSIQASVGWLATFGNLIPVAIGLGTVMLVSRLPELIPQVIFALKPTAWETAIGQGLQTPKWLLQGRDQAIATGATIAANRLTSPGVDANVNATNATVQGWGAAGVNLVAGFFGGKPRGT